MNESVGPFEVDDQGSIWYGKDLLFPNPSEKDLSIELMVKKVWIATSKCPWEGWRNELYDRNFIYDLAVTLQIKNLRENVKHFEREHPNAIYEYAEDPNVVWEVVKKWYSISTRKEFGDFGYTEWLTKNFKTFEDLHARQMMENGKCIAFSLWGQLYKDTAIHVICKDLGWSYLQDYTRFKTYEEMLSWKFEWCNDGGDAGEDGIGIYKQKLRPKFILPVWSWCRE
jgi:hypothetical protein